MCVYCYYVIMTFCYKVSDSRKKKSKISDCSSIKLVKSTFSVLFMYGMSVAMWVSNNLFGASGLSFVI